jgi:hypothetical protein
MTMTTDQARIEDRLRELRSKLAGDVVLDDELERRSAGSPRPALSRDGTRDLFDPGSTLPGRGSDLDRSDPRCV